MSEEKKRSLPWRYLQVLFIFAQKTSENVLQCTMDVIQEMQETI